MTALLTLDLATRTGFAFWRPGMERPTCGTLSLPKTGQDVGWFVDAYYDGLQDLLTVNQPELVVFEAPWVGPNTHQDTARKLLGLAVITEFGCRQAGVRYREANNASVRKHFIGKGRGDRKTLKAMTLKACRERGWDPSNDDEADALSVLDYTAHLRKLTVPWGVGGLFREAPAA